MSKLAFAVCAAAAISSASASIERGRLGLKGGQFDVQGFDNSGRDIFGFDTKGIDKWGRPITDGTAGLVAPVGKVDPPTPQPIKEPKVNPVPPYTPVPPPPPHTSTRTKTTVDVTPSFTPIPVTYTSDGITTTSMYVPTTAIYTVPTTYVPPEPTPSLNPQCQSVLVFSLNTCPNASLKPSGQPGINTVGDFIACHGFRQEVNGHEWQFLSYGCNQLNGQQQGVVTVLACGMSYTYKEVTIDVFKP